MYLLLFFRICVGSVPWWTLNRAVQVEALVGFIVLCSLARHFTLTVPLSTQVYKWVLTNLMLRGNPAMDWQHPIQGGVEIHLFTMLQKPE